MTANEITTAANPVLAPVSRSVVAPAYKARYAARAESAKLPKGVDRKVIARSCGDWLAKTLSVYCVKGRKADRAAFTAILEANGVDHSKWAALDNGRFRMTGGLALRRVIVDNDGLLNLADGSTLSAPRNWISAHTR